MNLPLLRARRLSGGGGAETSTQLVSQTYKVSEFTSTAASRSFEAESYEVTPWDLPDPQMHADATSIDELEVKTWSRNNDARWGHAFDSNGDLFTHGSYKVARIDVSENTQTVWTYPIDWHSGGSSHTVVGPSGRYYFSVGGNLTSLDPNTGTFTMWNMDGSLIFSSPDGIYLQPGAGIYIAKNENPQITGVSVGRFNDRFYVYGSGVSGAVNVDVVSPSGKIHTGSTYAYRDGTFDRGLAGFALTESWPYHYEDGNYTVRISDVFQMDEAVFTIESNNYGIVGHYGNSTEMNGVFLQKLDPDTGRITNFLVDESIIQSSHLGLLHHDSSDSLYFSYAHWHSHNGFADSLAKFVPESGEFTYWIDSSTKENVFHPSFGGVLAAHDENIYWGYHAGRHTLKIVTFDTNAGVINEIDMPYRCADRISNMVVDSSGTIFFHGCDNNFYKFTPSTNTFTKFLTGYYTHIGYKYLEIDSSDVIYWADYRFVGTASFVQPNPITVSNIETTSSTKIRIDTDQELHGLPNVLEFSVSGNTVYDVTLFDTMIVVTLDTTILHDDIVTISYSGSSIYSEDAIFETFVDMVVINNVVAEDESESPADPDPICDIGTVLIDGVCVAEQETTEEESGSPGLPEPVDTQVDEEG